MFNVYKVVTRKESGRLVSFNTSYSGMSRDLEYAIGKVTVPVIPNSLLFAFLDLDDAKRFIYMSENAEIYLAKTPSYVKGVYPQICGLSNSPQKEAELRLFWLNYKNPKDSVKNALVDFLYDYSSSVCCPSIELIKKVDICLNESQK